MNWKDVKEFGLGFWFAVWYITTFIVLCLIYLGLLKTLGLVIILYLIAKIAMWFITNTPCCIN